MNRHVSRSALLLVILCLTAGKCATAVPGERPVKSFVIEARQYAYDPPVIRVQKGDEVHIRLVSKDVVHGFFLEGHDIDARVVPDRETFWLKRKGNPDATEEEVKEIVFVAEKAGKFRYRCSHTCGYLHPFMMGEMIVSPNYLYVGSVGTGILLVVAMVVGSLWKKPAKEVS